MNNNIIDFPKKKVAADKPTHSFVPVTEENVSGYWTIPFTSIIFATYIHVPPYWRRLVYHHVLGWTWVSKATWNKILEDNKNGK